MIYLCVCIFNDIYQSVYQVHFFILSEGFIQLIKVFNQPLLFLSLGIDPIFGMISLCCFLIYLPLKLFLVVLIIGEKESLSTDRGPGAEFHAFSGAS
jgi:hypothetical protein